MRFLSVIASDLHFAFRIIRRNIGFSSVAILCVALGIGASSAMSSLVYALWVDPYPYRDSSRLLNLSFVDQQGRNGTMWYSLADYMELQHASVKCSDPINTTNFIKVRVTSGTLEGHVGRVCEDDVFRTVVWP